MDASSSFWRGTLRFSMDSNGYPSCDHGYSDTVRRSQVRHLRMRLRGTVLRRGSVELLGYNSEPDRSHERVMWYTIGDDSWVACSAGQGMNEEFFQRTMRSLRTGLTTYLVEVELVIIFSESLSVQAIKSDFGAKDVLGTLK